MLGHKTSLNKLKNVEIISKIFSSLKYEIYANNREKWENKHHTIHEK